MPWYRQLYWQIIIGMILGLILGLISVNLGWGPFINAWIKPWGTIFINLLKLVAIPMILTSLICGVASLSDLTKLSRIGGKTLGLYILTTALAVTLGLMLVNIASPGKSMPQSMKDKLNQMYAEKVANSQQTAEKVQGAGPLQPLVDMVPDNLFNSLDDNRNMLQIVFAAILIGIAMVLTDREKMEPARKVFESLNEIILQLVELVMRMAPLGVFAQIASIISELAGDNPAQALDLLKALGFYGVVVIVGLFLHIGLVYGTIIKFLTPISISKFYTEIRPVQLIAFSTSSSAATLPVTMERVEKGLGVSEDVCSFTLPLGCTVNMDGTALYQAVAAVFIAQVLGLDLNLGQQATIVLTATLASIGSAGVPGAGVVMLVIVLQSIHVPVEGIALILGIDRILDMFRTVVNVTGDAAVTCWVAHSEGKLNLPPQEAEQNKEKQE